MFQNMHLKSKVKEAEKEIIAIGQNQVSEPNYTYLKKIIIGLWINRFYRIM